MESKKWYTFGYQRFNGRLRCVRRKADCISYPDGGRGNPPGMTGRDVQHSESGRTASFAKDAIQD